MSVHGGDVYDVVVGSPALFEAVQKCSSSLDGDQRVDSGDFFARGLVSVLDDGTGQGEAGVIDKDVVRIEDTAPGRPGR